MLAVANLFEGPASSELMNSAPAVASLELLETNQGFQNDLFEPLEEIDTKANQVIGENIETIF